jgi:FAD:protein FMN transferase
MLNEAVSAAFDEIRQVDAMMSIHRSDSELSRLNARAAIEPVQVSPELFHVIASAQEISQQTAGGFDVTIRPLADLWGFVWKKDYRFPTQAELDSVLQRVNFKFIELNPAQRTIRFQRENVSIDLGGIAKGYAVDRAIERLRTRGITSAMVKAGGDLRVIGAPPGAQAWIVQLEDPHKRRARLEVPLQDAALSTSGDYENYFEHAGRRYSHILSPRTGMPVQGIAACTVIASTCMESDAWATACMIVGADQSIKSFGDRLAIRFTLRPEGTSDRLPVVQTKSFPIANN